jgi:hypothetical protein
VLPPGTTTEAHATPEALRLFAHLRAITGATVTHAQEIETTTTTTTADVTATTSTSLSDSSTVAGNESGVDALSRPNVIVLDVTDPRGRVYPVTPRFQQAGNKIRLIIPHSEEQFRAGRYHVHIEILQEDRLFVSDYDYFWGILAVNFNKSVYTIGDTVYAQIAVLDETGHTLCDVPLAVSVVDPRGEETVYTTGDGTVTASPTCGADNVTDTPDYFFHYMPTVEGTHQVTVTDLATGFSNSASFEARGFVPYDIERIGATRINPFASTYRMTLIAGVYENDFAGSIVERVPPGFEVVSHDADKVREGNDGTFLTWYREIPAGGKVQVSYVYQAPRITPLVFLLGKASLVERRNLLELVFGSGDGVLFEEVREWQLASDAKTLPEIDRIASADFDVSHFNDDLIFSHTPGAKHRCDVSPFSQTVAAGTDIAYSIALNGHVGTPFGVLIGGRPVGIRVTLTEVDEFTDEDAYAPLLVAVAPDAPTGSFSIVVAYIVDDTGTPRTATCQLNLVIAAP